MDELEFIGKVSAQKLSSVEEDNRAAQAQYRQDMMANALRRATSRKPQPVELTRKRLPEETLINEILRVFYEKNTELHTLCIRPCLRYWRILCGI